MRLSNDGFLMVICRYIYQHAEWKNKKTNKQIANELAEFDSGAD